MTAKATYNLHSKTDPALEEVTEEELATSPTRTLSPSPMPPLENGNKLVENGSGEEPPVQNGNGTDENGNGTVQNGNGTAENGNEIVDTAGEVTVP